MEAVTQFPVNLARVFGVRAAERVAGIQQITAVEDVGGVQRERPVFSAVPAQGQIRRGVRGQVRRTVSVHKAGSEVDHWSSPETARQLEGKHAAEGVALVVVEIEITGGRELDEAAGDGTEPLADGVGIDKPEPRVTPDLR